MTQEFFQDKAPTEPVTAVVKPDPAPVVPVDSPYSYLSDPYRAQSQVQGPQSPVAQPRPVFPQPQTLPALPTRQQPQQSTVKNSSGGGFFKFLFAFLAGGLVAAVGFLVGNGLQEDSQSAFTADPRPVSSIETTEGGELTPLIEQGTGVEAAIAVADALGPAVVQIEVAGNSGLGAGSGVVYREDLVITNNHVVEGASAVRVRQDTGRVLDAEIVGTNERIDIAVLRIVGSDFPVAQLALDEPAQVGQAAIAIGSPFLLQQTVTQGIVSAINRPIQSVFN